MRIAIANDVLMAAEVLRRVIVRAGGHEVVWIAHDGADAVARCERDRPDLILMDLFMPQLDGVEATRQIMARTPCAIVIATSKVEEHTGKVFEAMGAGAIDAVSIPVFTDLATGFIFGKYREYRMIARVATDFNAQFRQQPELRARQHQIPAWCDA